MLKSLQISSTGLRAQMVKHDIVANNLANVTTAGFKRILAKFSKEAGPEGAERLVVSSAFDFSAGTVKRTDNPLDLAIEGDGFFAVETPDGERYVRSGEFMLSEDGTIITPGGHTLVGATGPIQIDVTRGAIAVSQDGNITVGGESQGALKVVRFDKPSELVREGDNLYRADASAGPEELTGDEIKVLPGYVEESNVNPLREMVDMIKSLRTFQAMEKSIEASDDVLDTMVNQVGRAPAG